MSTLCIDTSTNEMVVVLLGDDGGILRSVTANARAQTLLNLVEEIVPASDRSVIERIVVGTGPGGFTGLRVGVSTARGLAEALAVPLYGVGSLLALAAGEDGPSASFEQIDSWWAVLDARRGEWFAQRFVRSADGDLAADSPLHVVRESELADLLGDARRVIGAPSPVGLAVAARQLITDSSLGAGDPATVIPHYGRAPDAEPARLQLRIDVLDSKDLDTLVQIEARCFRTPWSRLMYEEELQRPAVDAVQLAARDDAAGGRLLGGALAARIGDCWHVMNVLVDPPSQRRGIAHNLVAELLERSAALGVGEGWTLEVRAGNDAAVVLYERFGFVNSGRRPGYYSDSGEDALVMWRAADASLLPTRAATEVGNR